MNRHLIKPQGVHTVPDPARYQYRSDRLNCAHEYLLPQLLETLERFSLCRSEKRRVFDLGCGNGSVAAYLTSRGWTVVGVDPSASGVAQANAAHPELRIEQGSSEEALAARFGTFPIVVSLEVIEHVYAPRRFVRAIHELLEPGGLAVISTPYHGYWKNLALAVTGRLDAHFTALWDNGHIKFWSFRTLRLLLEECGFRDIRFKRVGRLPAFAKSMIATARK